jgi:uncharacterized protein YgbK (DUF1537 family)
MRNKIAVIADDLTGANDTGVQFAKQGLSTVVLMGTGHSVGAIEADVVVVDTNSRAVSPEQAYQKAAGAAALFREGPFKTIYKKVDSTLRGNLGSEIDGIMDTCGQDLAIVAPAFPKNNRVTVGGYLLVQGVPLEATEISRDLKCPVKESHLPTLLAGQTKRKVGHVGIKAILAGSDSIVNKLKELMAAGQQVIVCDVWREEQFNDIVKAAVLLNKPVLWVGSAGLAAHIPVPESDDSAAMAAPVVVVAGSISNVTRGQVSRLNKRSDMVHIEADTCALLRPESASAEIQRCFNNACSGVSAGKDVVITSGYSDETVAKTKDAGSSLGLSSQQTAESVAAAVGELCRQIATNLKLSGLVLTGGDIALSCCTALSATGFKVVKEVAPGIPVGVLKGGFCDGLPVVTKAGAFGDEEALCKSIDCLKHETKGVAK